MTCVVRSYRKQEYDRTFKICYARYARTELFVERTPTLTVLYQYVVRKVRNVQLYGMIVPDFFY